MHELTTGNVPAHLRRMVPVSFEAVVKGKARTATIWCTPDYLGVGEDTDWFRMPLTPQSAQGIADRLDCVLPTRRMVDAIWRQAAVQLEPAPFSPKHYDITSVATFYLSHSQIELQLGARQGPLVGGIKKDVVITPLTRHESGARRDLRLALAERQSDPAAVSRPRGLVRRLQPRHSPGRRAHDRRRRGDDGPGGAGRSAAPRPAERRGASAQLALCRRSAACAGGRSPRLSAPRCFWVEQSSPAARAAGEARLTPCRSWRCRRG
jgi:hypothetical protein